MLLELKIYVQYVKLLTDALNTLLLRNSPPYKCRAAAASINQSTLHHALTHLVTFTFSSLFTLNSSIVTLHSTITIAAIFHRYIYYNILHTHSSRPDNERSNESSGKKTLCTFLIRRHNKLVERILKIVQPFLYIVNIAINNNGGWARTQCYKSFLYKSLAN